MGNIQNANINDETNCGPRRIKKYIQSKVKKLRHNDRNTNSYDRFVSKFSNLRNMINDISLMDQRRVVFVSLTGLYLTWKDVPSFIMYNAILLIPLKKQWIYNPNRYKTQLSRHCRCSIYGTKSAKQFIELLKWKDKQQLVFWMLDKVPIDKCDINTNAKLVDPFWISFSDKLKCLHDPINNCTYSPIKLDPNEYGSGNYVSKYNIPISSILIELYFLQMKYKQISEIIYQSNPTSLLPVISYNKYDCIQRTYFKYNKQDDIGIDTDDDDDDDIEDDDSSDDDADLYISTDYDPNDTNPADLADFNNYMNQFKNV